jgi:DNA-directed RNA polymerase alpha subunit
MWRELMSHGRQFSKEDAKAIGNGLGINWEEVDLEEFRMGLGVELEHGTHDPETNVTDDDEAQTAKIALAHLREFPDYYTRLKRLEAEADAYWSQREEK